MSAIKKLPPARRDLVDIFRHYTVSASHSVARRFLVQAEATFLRLAKMPGIGTRYNPDEPLYADLRDFPISRFPKYIVFYRPMEAGVELIRVLHGARDLDGLLADDFGIDPEAPEEQQ